MQSHYHPDLLPAAPDVLHHRGAGDEIDVHPVLQEIGLDDSDTNT